MVARVRRFHMTALPALKPTPPAHDPEKWEPVFGK
jgi:hypothetical protein